MKVTYYQKDINYCFFELGMVLLQLNNRYDRNGHIRFGFYDSKSKPLEDTVVIWRIKIVE